MWSGLAVRAENAGACRQPAGVTSHYLNDGDGRDRINSAVADYFLKGRRYILCRRAESRCVVGLGNVVVDGLGNSDDLNVYPLFGEIAVQLHYGDCLDDVAYNDILVSACAQNGIAAFTGDGTDANVMIAATKAIKNANGTGIPTVKPWNIDTIREKMELIHDSGAFAVAMDVDAAGLPFLKNLDPPAGSKTVAELREIIQLSGAPFIVKGIMTVKGALKAKEAGASAIIVSNHGGRVLDQCPATAEVLGDIVKALDGSGIKILVDGGIRSGTDIFKALALGADGVVIARPFVTAVYGGEHDGVRSYIEKIGTELEDTMKMCGVSSLSEITRDCVMTF